MTEASPSWRHLGLPGVGLMGCALLVAACGSAADPGNATGGGNSVAGEPDNPGHGGSSSGATSSSGGALTTAGGASAGGESAGSGNGAGRGGSGGAGSGGASAGGASAGGASAGGAASLAGSGGDSAGGATAGSAGSAGAGGSAPNNDYLKTKASGYGFVEIAASSKNQIVNLTTTLSVPIKPTANTGTLFLWPGLQPGGANYLPIDNGVLQPVLTWGPTCAPNAPKNGYASWWVSAQYVNTYGSDPGYTGCLGGPGMNVQVADALVMVMSLNGTLWHQTVTDSETQQSVSYDIDMLGQAQNYAEFVIEMYTESPAADVVFSATTVTFAAAEAGACQPTTRGMNDFFTNPKASSDGKQCTIDRIVLRAQGVAATTPN